MYPHLMQHELARIENDRQAQTIRDRDLRHRAAARAARAARKEAAGTRPYLLRRWALALWNARNRNRVAEPAPAPYLGPVALRLARPLDDIAVERVAALDASTVPPGRLLVAEVNGRVVAAISLRGGEVVRDPYSPTAPIVRLLELRAAQLNHTLARHSAQPGRPRRILRPSRAEAA